MRSNLVIDLKIGKTICVKCGKVEDLTKEQLVEVIEDAKTIDELKAIFNQARLGKDIELLLICEECEAGSSGENQ